MPDSTFTVATANTHEARMLRHADGLKPFRDREVGVLLLQEVLGMSAQQVGERLNQDEYELVNFDPTLGLAIAVDRNAAIQMVDGQADRSPIHATTTVEKLLKTGQISHRLRERGIIGSKLIVNNGSEVTVATAHPIVFIRFLSRYKQINALGDVLQTPFYDTERVILGADMNHYPGPQRVDLAMQTRVGLHRVEFEDPTWQIEGSKHEWMAKLGALITGRSLDSFDAELDALLYKGLDVVSASVIPIESDHGSGLARFRLL